MYKVFHRTWWRMNPEWPDGLEPHAGRKTYMSHTSTEEKAQEMCRFFNKHNPAGKLSRKAEYEDA